MPRNTRTLVEYQLMANGLKQFSYSKVESLLFTA